MRSPKSYLQRKHQSAFTLVELLVTISIVSLLIALTIPAIEAARESARRVTCDNNLRQLGLAAIQHESLQKHFPTNGWGYGWVGDPDKGFGREQPGGWIYNILPYIEQEALRTVGAGKTFEEKKSLLKTVIQTPLRQFVCPTRRSGALLPSGNRYANADSSPLVAKTDYAICEGDFITDSQAGPKSNSRADIAEYQWTDVSKATGVSFERSEVTAAEILGGLSNTILIGEKYVAADEYETDRDPGFDQSMYAGVDLDISRWTIEPPLQDGGLIEQRRFGSAHHGSCSFVFADGRVERVGYGMALQRTQPLGN